MYSILLSPQGQGASLSQKQFSLLLHVLCGPLTPLFWFFLSLQRIQTSPGCVVSPEIHIAVCREFECAEGRDFMTIAPYIIWALLFSLLPLSRLVNRPRALRRLNLNSLLSDFVEQDVESIESSARPALLHTPSPPIANAVPILNLRPTPKERQIVEMPKPSEHCQYCRHCVKTAVVHGRQWIRCDNPFRVTTNGSNRHEWHRPEAKLPCFS